MIILLSPTSRDLRILQVQNCQNNSQVGLVVDYNFNSKFRPESVNFVYLLYLFVCIMTRAIEHWDSLFLCMRGAEGAEHTE